MLKKHGLKYDGDDFGEEWIQSTNEFSPYSNLFTLLEEVEHSTRLKYSAEIIHFITETLT
jgi:hypothetical protein